VLQYATINVDIKKAINGSKAQYTDVLYYLLHLSKQMFY